MAFTITPLVAPAAATPCAAATWSHHVALVVEHGDGSSVRLCIGFDAPNISGSDILAASGLEVATAQYSGLGGAVCQIDHEPATYPPGCWTTTSEYWAMFVSRHGAPWQPADHGISAEMFGDGDAEGFRYESQSSTAVPVSAVGTCALAVSTAAASEPPSAHASAASPSRVASAAASSAEAQPVATPGVAAVAEPPVARTAAAAGLSPGLLGGIVAAGALLGVLGAQLVARRRRT